MKDKEAREEIKKLKGHIAKLERKIDQLGNCVGVRTSSPLDRYWPRSSQYSPVNEVLTALIEHLGLEAKHIPPGEDKVVLEEICNSTPRPDPPPPGKTVKE